MGVILTQNDAQEVACSYQKQGYCLCPGFFSAQELESFHEIVLRFHRAWLADNAELYRSRAINSAWLTGTRYLGAADRRALFQFIGRDRIAELLQALFPGPPAFLNTQLFFNPFDPGQKNYWHRDIQYTGLTLAEQREALGRSNVIHLRVPLQMEPGLELVPGSHLRWDNEEEFAVRMQENGHLSNESLLTGRCVALMPGDLLIFSANMLHRGLYGMNRLAFDMLFCDCDPALLQYAARDCLPGPEDIAVIENPAVFLHTLQTGLSSD